MKKGNATGTRYLYQRYVLLQTVAFRRVCHPFQVEAEDLFIHKVLLTNSLHGMFTATIMHLDFLQGPVFCHASILVIRPEGLRRSWRCFLRGIEQIIHHFVFKNRRRRLVSRFLLRLLCLNLLSGLLQPKIRRCWQVTPSECRLFCCSLNAYFAVCVH